MKKVINEIDETVTFIFDGLDSLVIRLADVTKPNQQYAKLAGIGHKVGDNAAFSKALYPSGVTEAMRRNAAQEMVNHLTTSDSWDMTVRKPKAAPQNPTIAAIAVKLGISYEEAQAKVAEQFLASME